MKTAALYLALAAAAIAQEPSLKGRWDGTIVFHDLKVPFTMQFEGVGPAISGAFINGDERVKSTSGSFSDGVLRLTFDQQGTRLEAKVADGAFKGSYGGAQYGKHTVEAAPYCTCSYEGEAGPDISGAWDIALDGRKPWRLVVRRKGEDTSALIERPDGGVGAHTGRFDGAQFTLNRFDGVKASLMEIEPRKDGTLELRLTEPRQGTKKYTASRAVGGS